MGQRGKQRSAARRARMCPRPDNHNANNAVAAKSAPDSLALLITPPTPSLQSTQLLHDSSVFFKRATQSRCSRFFGGVGRGLGNLLLLPFRVLFYCACKICAAVRFVVCCGRSKAPPPVIYNYAPANGGYPPGGNIHYAKQSLAGPNVHFADDSPAHWEPLDASTKAHGNTSLVLLSKDKHGDEIADVIQNFERTGPRGVIKTVHRVQNKSILTKYLQKREEMLDSGLKRGKVSDIRADLLVFHGTRMTPPAKIHASESGFDPSLGKSAPNWLWFASEARYSAQGFAHTVVNDKIPFSAAGSGPMVGPLKQIFQVRITMDCCPAPINPKPVPQRFGVQTNSRQCLVGPNIYTLTDGSQCLPEYLITFS